MEQIDFSTNSAGTTGHSHAKNESRHRLYTFHKDQLKMDHWPKCKTQNYETPKDNIGENLNTLGMVMSF